MSILVLAPHADDETLGAGGFVAKAAARGERVTVAVLTGHGPGKHPLFAASGFEDVRRECAEACEVLGVAELLFRELPAACLDHTPTWQINRVVQELVEQVMPEQLLVPFAGDLHRDHGAIAYAAAVATRPYLSLGRQVRRILAYETLSETHLGAPYLEPAFQPNVFIDIGDHLQVKIAAMRRYGTQLQADRQPRSVRALTALAHLRGSHVGLDAAEAFVLLRALD